MRTIKFHTTEYQLVDHENVMPSGIQATLLKEDHTVEEIAEDATGAEEIKVYEDETLVATYTGYTDMRAISMYGHEEGMVVSVELDNHDVYSQLNNMAEDISAIEEVQDAHTNNLSELNQEVAELTPYVETKIGYYGETEKTFYNVPEGRVSVFFSDYNGSYSINRIEDRLTVSFDALEEATNITISIQ